MKKWNIIKNILVEKLVFWWKWFATLKSENKDLDWKKIFITGSAIPWSIVDLKVLKKRKDFLETQIVETIKKSPIEKKHENNPYWECWWCKWVNIPYDEQLKIKQNQVKEAFFHLEKYIDDENMFKNIVPSPLVDWYRNKVEFSFGKYISHKEEKEEHFNVWFHKQWSFRQIQDYDWCILIDDLQNKIYKEIKDFSKNSWLPVYDSKPQTGFFRHIILRRTFFTNQIMIILWFNSDFKTENLNEKINETKIFLQNLAKKYSEIKSIYFSHNNNKADISIWELELIYWEKFINEKLLWLEFNISPKSFFQTNSTWAEVLYQNVSNLIKKDNLEDFVVLDLYAWTWTIWMIISKLWVKKVISVELVKQASKDWEKNAELNWLKNLEFINDKTENFLEEYLNRWLKADLLIIDPPRAWMYPKAIEDIVKFWTNQIIYVSCNPATLARDLEFILENANYKIETVIPVDMFPHTHHIETIVCLIKK